MPLALAAMAAALVGTRRLGSHPGAADRAIAAAIGCSVLSIAAADVSTLAVAGVALAGLILCALLRRPTLTVSSLVSGAYLALTLTGRADGVFQWSASTVIDLALAIAGGLLCVDCRCSVTRRSSRSGRCQCSWRRACWPPVSCPTCSLFSATVALAVVGSYCIARQPQLALPVAAMTAIVSVAQVGDLRWPSVVAMLLSGAVALIGRQSPWLRIAASAQFVTAAWLAVQVAGATPSAVVGWMIVTAIVLTGITFTTPRVIGLDAAGLTATALAGLVGARPWRTSGVDLPDRDRRQCSGLGLRNRPTPRGPGDRIGSMRNGLRWPACGSPRAQTPRCSRGSLRYDFTGADLVALAVSAAMLFVGLGLRRRHGVSTWLAYGPGLALVSAWLAAVEMQRGADGQPWPAS